MPGSPCPEQLPSRVDPKHSHRWSVNVVFCKVTMTLATEGYLRGSRPLWLCLIPKLSPLDSGSRFRSPSPPHMAERSGTALFWEQPPAGAGCLGVSAPGLEPVTLPKGADSSDGLLLHSPSRQPAARSQCGTGPGEASGRRAPGAGRDQARNPVPRPGGR